MVQNGPRLQENTLCLVSLGEHNISNPAIAAVYDGFLMQSVRIHEGYVPGQKNHDIAVIYLQVIHKAVTVVTEGKTEFGHKFLSPPSTGKG